MTMGHSNGHFAGFRSSSDSPRLQPDPHVLKELDRIVEAFARLASYLRFPEGFIDAMGDNFVEAFRRLDAIDRDDPFWDGTNRRPTQYKLAASCEFALRSDPFDCETLRIRASVQLVFEFSFDPGLWERMALAGCVDPAWIIYAALHAECLGAYNTVPNLVILLQRTQLSDRVIETLEGVIANGFDEPEDAALSRKRAADSARRVLEDLGGGR